MMATGMEAVVGVGQDGAGQFHAVHLGHVQIGQNQVHLVTWRSFSMASLPWPASSEFDNGQAGELDGAV